jgi:hypothetical protein
MKLGMCVMASEPVNVLYVVACRVVAKQQPRDGRIYQDHFWATAR